MAADWNRQSDDVVFPDHVVKTLTLEEDSDKYARLREFFLRRVADLPPGWLFWVEKREAKYDKSDLLSARAVTVHTWHEAGSSGNRYGNVYEHHCCPACEKRVIDRQLRNPIANVGRLTSDFAETTFGELFVSDNVRQILSQLGEIGISFRPVESPPKKPTHKSYFQMNVTRIARPLVEHHSVFGGYFKVCGLPTWRSESPMTLEEADAVRYGTKVDPWTFTSTNGPGPWTETRLRESSLDGWDVACSDLAFGSSSPRDEGVSVFWEFYVSPRVTRKFLEAKLRGALYQPITVVP